jgi:hypothetical protein
VAVTVAAELWGKHAEHEVGVVPARKSIRTVRKDDSAVCEPELNEHSKKFLRGCRYYGFHMCVLFFFPIGTKIRIWHIEWRGVAWFLI